VTHGVPHRSTASVGHDRLSQNVLVHARTVVLLADRILAIRTTSSGMTTLATRISDVVAGASAGVDGRGDTFSADQRTWERKRHSFRIARQWRRNVSGGQYY